MHNIIGRLYNINGDNYYMIYGANKNVRYMMGGMVSIYRQNDQSLEKIYEIDDLAKAIEFMSELRTN